MVTSAVCCIVSLLPLIQQPFDIFASDTHVILLLRAADRWSRAAPAHPIRRTFSVVRFTTSRFSLRMRCCQDPPAETDHISAITFVAIRHACTAFVQIDHIEQRRRRLPVGSGVAAGDDHHIRHLRSFQVTPTGPNSGTITGFHNASIQLFPQAGLGMGPLSAAQITTPRPSL
jgi:hypothetical protein